MSTAIKNKISPPEIHNTYNFNDASVRDKHPVQDSTGPKETIDFKALLGDSNQATKRERQALRNGQFSTAKNDQELFDAMHKLKNPNQRIPKNTMGKDEFMKLFVAQLQNQDPLAPKDHSDMAAQLAQFNGLEQMLNVNKTLEKMNTAQALGRSMNLINFVGKDVTVNGGKVRLKDGEMNQLEFSLEKPVPQATLEIRDDGGKVVLEKEMGTLKEGKHPLEWDGLNGKGEKVTDGVYSIAITAKDMQGSQVPVVLKSTVTITGVDIKNEGTLYSNLGPLGVDEIAAIGSKNFQDDGGVAADRLLKKEENPLNAEKSEASAGDLSQSLPESIQEKLLQAYQKSPPSSLPL